jgi:hypothetical protein
MSSILLPATVALLRTVRECRPLFPNMIAAELFDARHTIGDLKVLPSTAGGFIVFRAGMPNGQGVVESGLRTEDEAHAALERHAGRITKKRKAA